MTDGEQRLEFGPYAGLTVEEVVDLDPEHLRRMVAADIGSPEVRARAARLLLTRPRSKDLRRGWGQGFVAAGVFMAVIWGAHSAIDRAETPAASALVVPTEVEAGLAEARSAPARLPGSREVVNPDVSEAATSHASAVPDRSDEATDAVGVDRLKECGLRATGSIDADTAERSAGTDAAVEFRVVGTHDTGKVTFLNSHDPYQDNFYVAIFPDDYDAFPAPPTEYFHGRCVVVQGRIELYRGTAQIVLRRPSDIVVVGD